MTIPTEAFIAVLILTAIAFGILGWDLAVHNHRARRRALEIRAADLKAQFDRFTEDLDQDPQRAWIDVGKRNALHQMEMTVRAIRKDLEPQS